MPPHRDTPGQGTTAITIRTTIPTLPLPPSSSRPQITTPRLLLRALVPSDLDAVYALRRQPEVMRWTMTGCADPDKEQTASRLALYLPPNDADTFNYAICLRETGELVGMGGVHLLERAVGVKFGFGWPEVGYALRREFWGRGMATEFLRGFLELWEGLPREVVERRVDVRSLVGGRVEEGDLVAEHLLGVTNGLNRGSQGVLAKSGFEKFLVYEDVDIHDAEKMMEVVVFRYLPQNGTVG